jgi:septal ring factor EnvC (AmiA/AmiB activator)
VEEKPRRSYRWYMKSSLHRRETKKLDNYERHLKKESSAKYYKKMSAKSFQDQLKRLNSRIQASQKRLSELRSKKKSLATMMYRETSKPEVY